MSKNSNIRVAVIGGGISGLTTAILLQVNGYRTFLYSEERPSHEPDYERRPEFATLHAAASVLPHSVSSSKVAYWTKISQEFFRALSFRATCGVRTQLHYEIFEDPINGKPAYWDSVENFELLEEDALKASWVPRRAAAESITGWKFDAFFCEVPEYVRYLYLLYQDIGGRLAENPPGNHGLPAYLRLDYDFYVNCTGCSAHAFLASASHEKGFEDRPEDPRFEPLLDPVPMKLIRGHYLRVDIKEVMTGDSGRFFSYNYKPTADIYQTASGSPADVYCYPRSDAWILGGSRQEGNLDEEGKWNGEETVGEEIEFPHSPLRVPSPILNLNSEILDRISKGQLNLRRLVKENPDIVAPGVGYRFVRDSRSDSVRLACSRVRFRGADKFVYHNYGHGGSGFTLSWGCAFDLLRLFDLETEQPTRQRVTPDRRKFVLANAATRLILLDLTARLLEG